MSAVGKKEVGEKKGRICPVCGKHRFKELDMYEICPVCGWEDDGLQADDHEYWGGANDMSVNQAREAYKEGRPID